MSSRMGLPKATLPFGPELMIERVLRLLGQAVDSLVVVAAPDQELPELPAAVTIARDRHEGFGPLEGLHAGLTAIRDQADAAYVTGCDVPLLEPGFVRYLIDCLEGHQIAVPFDGKFYQPLATVYRTNILSELETLLREGHRRPVSLYGIVDTHRVPIEQLKTRDPELETLANLNSPEDYFAAVQRAGFEVPPEIRRALTA
ncbi:MAG: molybdenum cofactor guanylyltransferase [Planctomycetes bacterium]|nr:molybdenum cofactor guanylyltransferase [Planctomycetota bacterium]MBL7038714.1 molybdenum cofactor guanylyltransferase [Pirellulaceae bacterium]